MTDILKPYMDAYNEKVTECEKLPPGVDRALMKQVCERIHKELCMAANMIETGKNADYILARIDKLI